MTDTEPSIDLSRLEKVRHHGSKLISRCPACAEEGRDRKGQHFFMFSASGKWGCVANPGDREHNRHIFALVGIKGEFSPDPLERRRWRARRVLEVRKDRRRRGLSAEAMEKRVAIIKRYKWEPADVWDDSPQRIDGPLVASDPAHFLQSLFPGDTFLWTGEPFHSGPGHGNHWKTCREWRDLPSSQLGPMTAPATWKFGTISRCAANVLCAPYTVLDFDGMDGTPPRTREDLAMHLHASLALILWMREALDAELAALLFTGGKSLHAWIKTPGSEALQSIVDVSKPLGIDAGLIGHPEHPCRLPGHPHHKTGKPSRVLWLQIPEE